ncbi:uncharacterized protein LOC134277830 [Saccostrea cucullata]|uniref:uncharacterized protein LOC134277830 n=1 Tax=Saccostrea cuccullata TaxID=36930 RepID=UPI002ED26C43
MPGQFRCAGDILFTDHPPIPGQISDVQLKQFSETSNFLQCLEPLTTDKPFFFAQIRALSNNSKISIGIAGPDIAEDGTPGHWINTVGYSSEGICRTSHNEIANTYGAKYSIGDVFGVFVSHFGKQMSTVIFIKNGQPVATRLHFEPDHKKFLPTITLENGPIDLGIMWPQAVMVKPQFSDKNMIQWITSPGVSYNMADNMFVFNPDTENQGTIQSPTSLSREFEHYEVVIQKVSESGAGPAVGIATCSLLKPTPTCKALVDFFRLFADGKNVKLSEGQRVGIGVHYPRDVREKQDHDDKTQQLVLVFVTLDTKIGYAKVVVQPEGGFFPMVVLNKNGSKVTVDVTTNRKIETYENLDPMFEEHLEEANRLLLNDSLKRQLKHEMFRKSEQLKIEVNEQTAMVDLSKQFCRVCLSKDAMGIHLIQFRQPLTKGSPYFCIEIRKLNEDSVLTIGLADSKFPLNKHPGKVPESTGYCSRDGKLYYNKQHEGHSQGERFGEGDMVGVEVSNFGRKHPVALFSKNWRGIDTRYVTILDQDQILPTVAVCGNGYDVEIDIFWQNQYLKGPPFNEHNPQDWCYPKDVTVDRKNRIFTAPEHNEPILIQSPRPFDPESNYDYFEVQILDKFGKEAGAPPPGIALSSPCSQDITPGSSSNFRQDYVRFLAVDEAESSVSVGDKIGWGVIFPDSELKKQEDRLIICYLCINLTVVLTRVIYEPPGGVYPIIMLPRSANRVKLGTIIHIHTHPITPDVQSELIQEAKDLIAEEKRVTAEGGDPHEMNIDKNLFKAFVLETPDPKQDNKNPAKVATVIMAANAFQRKKKSVSCVLL